MRPCLIGKFSESGSFLLASGRPLCILISFRDCPFQEHQSVCVSPAASNPGGPVMAIPDIPGYNVVEKIREGATATSWKAIQTSLRRPVVLKILNTDGTPEDQNKVQSILNQMRRVSSLKHAAFFELIDMGERNGMHYVVMGGSDGQTANELLAKQSPFPEKDILRIAADMAEALDYAWTEKRIYHGNIKPDNIVIHSDGSTLIADMGLARTEPHCDPATGETHEIIVGTPNYMSPEQVQGRANLDFRTDIYSLGATLYQLATGIIPFDDIDGERAMRRHILDFLPNPRDINPGISPAIAGIIEKMMMKSPDKRYKSWSDLLADLKRAKANRFFVPQIEDTALSTVKTWRSQPSPVSRVSAPGGGGPNPPKRSPFRVILRMMQWLLVLGLWVFLAYQLLKPPPPC